MSRLNKWAPTLFFCLGFLFPQGLPAQQAVARTVKIPDGTIVRLAITEGLDSATNEVNDTVRLEAVEDVKVGDVIAVPKGSAGVGHVTDVDKKKRMGRGGKLNFTVDYVKAADGSNLRLRASSSAKGKEKTGTVIATTVLVSPLFLLMHGKDVKVPKGTEFNAYVDGDREVAFAAPSPTPPAQAVAQPAAPSATPAPTQPTAQPAAQPTAPPAPATATAPAPEDLCTVVVKSTPDGADITVDGNFAGNTPSTLRLPAGSHTLLIEKSGMKSWQRTMTASPGGNVTIDAKLEQAQ
jgi:hypothetical protein